MIMLTNNPSTFYLPPLFADFKALASNLSPPGSRRARPRSILMRFVPLGDPSRDERTVSVVPISQYVAIKHV